jgi:hypothetical protein
MPKALGVVQILIAGEATVDGLPEQSGQGVSPILASARIGQNLARHLCQSERVVEFAIGEQAGVRGDDRAPKLQHQAALKIESESLASRFTCRVRHGRLAQRSITL